MKKVKFKKIVTLIILVIAVMAMTIFTSFAEDSDLNTTEDPATEVENENVTVTDEDAATIDEETFYDRIIEFVADGALWAKIGAIAVSVIALIAAIKSNLTKIADALSSLKQLISGKATKEETESAVSNAITGVREDFNSQSTALQENYDSLNAKYDQLTAVLTLVTLQIIKSPNARTQIMALISDADKYSGEVSEIVETIQEEIAAADAAEEKVETPAIDAVIATADAASAQNASYIRLG